jgi:hypothetical protein
VINGFGIDVSIGKLSTRGGKGRRTLSGSSAHTFRPGFALSGNTHSLEGFANTFPADEDVSLLLLPLATGVDDVEAVLGRETIDGREGIAIFAFV